MALTFGIYDFGRHDLDLLLVAATTEAKMTRFEVTFKFVIYYNVSM